MSIKGLMYALLLPVTGVSVGDVTAQESAALNYEDSVRIDSLVNAYHVQEGGSEVSVDVQGKLTLNGKTYRQDETIILMTHRFEGESDPGDAAILYVIQTNDGSIGYCMDGYGMYSSHTNDLHSEFIHNAVIGTSYHR